MQSLSKSIAYYLAGPMGGIPQMNFPVFMAAAANLRGEGYQIVSPAEIDDPETQAASMRSDTGAVSNAEWADFLSRDVKIVVNEVKGIILLPGWHLSRGARLEVFIGLLMGHSFGYWDESYGAIPYSRDGIRSALMRNLP